MSEVEPSTLGPREIKNATVHNLSMRTNCKEIIITQGSLVCYGPLTLTKPDIIGAITFGVGYPCTIAIEETITPFGDLSSR
jgi:hypothetical protein